MRAMADEIRMPKLSDNMEDGLVIRWLKAPGDEVAAGEPLVEVETEKADVEVEAPASGTLAEIVVAEGERASVGAVLARLGSGDGKSAAPAAPRAPEPAAAPAAPSPSAPAAQPKRTAPGPAAAPVPPPPSRQVEPPAGEPAAASRRATPLARRVASASGQDLADVESASGAGGRIAARDVAAAVSRRRAPDPGEAERGEVVSPAAGGETVQEHSRMRQAIARRMYEAKRDVPHFYIGVEIDMGEASRIRASIKESGALEGFTITHLLLRALAVTLPRHPRLNASYQEQGVALHREVNIGVAVAVEDGLLVPVLHSVQDLSLRALVEKSNALIERARRGKVHGDDLSGGTFSLSNVGMLDVDELTAIINPPQAAILGVAAIRDRAVVRDGEIAVAKTMRASLSCDHRVVNGVEAGHFLAALKQILERPAALLLDS